MKYIFGFLVLVSLASCYKANEPDCTEKTKCIRIAHTYQTCTNGRFDHVFSDTVRAEVSVCDAIEWVAQAKSAEENLRAANAEFDNFLNQYPTDCHCGD